MANKEPYVGALVDGMRPNGERWVGVIIEILDASSFPYTVWWKLAIHPSIYENGTVGVKDVDLRGLYSRDQLNVL